MKMSCEAVFKDICHIHARLFDHRSAFKGHINFFVKEFEDKRGDREKIRLEQTQERLMQCRDHILPNIQSNFAENLSFIKDTIKQAEADCKALAESGNEKKPESEFLRTQREARQHELDNFMKQQCVRSARVDQQFEDNIKLFTSSYEDLKQQLNEGIHFTNQTYYKFMALGKEFS